MTDDEVATLARATVIVLGVISLCLAIYSSTTRVSLLLTEYAGVTQFFPGVVLGLYWKRVTMPAVFAGMIAGVATAVFLMLSHRDPVFGLSAGFLALCLNFLIAVFASLLTPALRSDLDAASCNGTLFRNGLEDTANQLLHDDAIALISLGDARAKVPESMEFQLFWVDVSHEHYGKRVVALALYDVNSVIVSYTFV